MIQMPVRLGIVGAGGFTRRFHIPNFLKIPGVEVVAVCNRSIDSGKAVAREFGFDMVLADWRELVHLPNIDAVVIGTWPYMHSEVAVEALSAGKHVFTEAHMAGDLEGARSMYMAAQNNPHLKTMLSNLRVPGDMLMRQLLTNGYVGNLRQVVDYRSNDQYVDVSGELHWRQNRKYSGINFQYLGVSAEINRRWFGDHTRVFAQSKTFHPKTVSSHSYEKLPDTMNVLSEFEDGTPIVYLHSGVTRFSGSPRLEIYGDEGTLVYHWQNRLNAVTGIFGAKAGDSELAQIPIPPELESNWSMNEDFIGMIRYDNIPSPELATFYDGLKYTEFTTACFKSLEAGTWIDLPLSW
jgi:predicted dehydrogenase